MSGFTTDDIALGVEIRGVYDGVSVWLLKDGRVINRWEAEVSRRADRTRQWIEDNEDQLRRNNADLLNPDVKWPTAHTAKATATQSPNAPANGETADTATEQNTP